MASTKATAIPRLVYGTAWKQEATRTLVKQALQAGFRGIDTAAQPKHYREDLVGQGIRDAIAEGIVKREDLYIQTKYTSPHGQDPRRMPYKPDKSITCQVGASLTSSLKHLRHEEAGPTKPGSRQPYLDCLLLHSPFPSHSSTQEAWRAMELHVPTSTLTLGLSNVYEVDLLKKIYDFAAAATKPRVLQNRFYPATGWDREVRAFCVEKGIVYQSFWTLTANPELLRSEVVGEVAGKVGVVEEVALYALVLGLGRVSVLDGTTNEGRMRADLEGVKKVGEWAEREAESWKEVMGRFRDVVG